MIGMAIAAGTTGFLMGLAYFHGLWWSVRGLTRNSVGRMALMRAWRFAGAVGTFFALTILGGALATVIGLCGFGLARWWSIQTVGEPNNAAR